MNNEELQIRGAISLMTKEEQEKIFEYYDMFKKLIDNGGYKYFGIGKYICDGRDVFEINDNILNSILKNIYNPSFDKYNVLKYYKAYVFSYDGPGFADIKFDISCLNKVPMEDRSNIRIIATEADFHGTGTVIDLENKYISG